MAFGDWDAVIKELTETYLPSKYATHARAMLTLIPQIRSLPELEGVLPGTTHGTLFLKVADKRETVNVWYFDDGAYSVYFAHPTQGELKVLTATAEDIVPTVQAAVMELKAMDGAL